MFGRKKKANTAEEGRLSYLEHVVKFEAPVWEMLDRDTMDSLLKYYTPEEICVAYNIPVEEKVQGYHWQSKDDNIPLRVSEINLESYIKGYNQSKFIMSHKYNNRILGRCYFMSGTKKSSLYSKLTRQSTVIMIDQESIQEISEDEYLAVFKPASSFITSFNDILKIREIGLNPFIKMEYTKRLKASEVYSKEFLNWLLINKEEDAWARALALSTENISPDTRALLILTAN